MRESVMRESVMRESDPGPFWGSNCSSIMDLIGSVPLTPALSRSDGGGRAPENADYFG